MGSGFFFLSMVNVLFTIILDAIHAHQRKSMPEAASHRSKLLLSGMVNMRPLGVQGTPHKKDKFVHKNKKWTAYA